MKKILCTWTFLLSFNFLFAQNCKCSEALIQDMVSINVDKRTYLEYLNTIDKSTYRKISSEGGFQFEVPIDGVPIGAGHDHNDLKKFANHWSEKLYGRSFSENSSNYMEKKLSGLSYSAYIACLRECSGAPGLHVTVINNTYETVSIRLKYHAGRKAEPDDLKSIKVVKSKLYNGKVEEVNVKTGEILLKGETLHPNSEDHIIIKREGNKTVEGTIHAGALSTYFKVPMYKRIIPFSPPKLEQVSIDAASYNRSESFNICNNCLPAKYGDGFITNDQLPPQKNRAVYDVNFDYFGKYRIEVLLASEGERPFQIRFNGKVIKNSACGAITRGWFARNAAWVNSGAVVNVEPGKNKLIFSRGEPFPHIRKIRFVPVK